MRLHLKLLVKKEFNMRKTGIIAFGFIILMITSAAFAAPVPDTGQTACYDGYGNVVLPCPSPDQPFYGQNGNYSINPLSYTKLDGNGNVLSGSVTSWAMTRDNVTGLIWEVKTSMGNGADYSDPHNADNTYTWYDSNPATNGGYAGTPGNGKTTYSTEDFINALNSSHFGGYTDWRLPSVNELKSIVNYGIPDSLPAITKEYFPNTQASVYWSSDTYPYYIAYPDSSWFVYFFDGSNGYSSKSQRGYVRAVRGGQLSSAAPYTDNGDGTVTDTSTGLMWQQSASTDEMIWEDALSYCVNLKFAGYTDWRMPTIKELCSLVEYSTTYSGLTINTTFFLNTQSFGYWTSTTNTSDPADAWSLNFYNGYDNYNYKDNSYFIRAVRGGQSGAANSPVISVSPLIQNVNNDAGTTPFSVSNTGTGAMPWTASVISGAGWLSIISGSTGTNSGTIHCSFSLNTSTSLRTGTIRITAIGAAGSPVDVSVVQAGSPTPETACTAVIDSNLAFNIPYITYLSPMPGDNPFWADFAYVYNSDYPASIIFKYVNSAVIMNNSFTCASATLSSDSTIHVPDVLLPDGITHIWLDLTYTAALSTDKDIYFVVTNAGMAEAD